MAEVVEAQVEAQVPPRAEVAVGPEAVGVVEVAEEAEADGVEAQAPVVAVLAVGHPQHHRPQAVVALEAPRACHRLARLLRHPARRSPVRPPRRRARP